MISETPLYLAAAFPQIQIGVTPASDSQGVAASLQILAVLTILSLAPAILLMMTSFTRIVIVLSFVRNAVATAQIPPNQVLIGLALFLTFFTMAPVFGQIYNDAWIPFQEGSITQAEALQRAEEPLREFMLRQTREKDLALFVQAAGLEQPQSPDDLSLTVIIPSFMISELRTAFEIGFLLFIPFIVIDMVVSSTLMSMGMLMLPPMLISLPFKILLFVMVDGWNLIAGQLINSFR